MDKLLKGSLELNQMFAALQRTAAKIRRDFGEIEQLQQSLSGARDFAAKAEKRIEEMVLSDLTLVRPNAGILTPNVSRDGDGISEFITSKSGAANIVRGNPHFAMSLALRVNGETKVGLIYSPIDDRLYYAEKGSGAFIFSAFHSVRMRVSKLKDQKDLMIGFDSAAMLSAHNLPLATRRITGCPVLDLAWVAAGKFDAFISEPLNYAEIAAGELIVTEAGGKMWEENGQLFVTNGVVEI